MELVAMLWRTAVLLAFVRDSNLITRYDLRKRLKAKQETGKSLTISVVLYVE
jgi:hypothetical protein